MSCPFTGPKLLCARPKIELHLVPLQKHLRLHKKFGPVNTIKLFWDKTYVPAKADFSNMRF